jgi:acetoin:2,6-dichlorophenolindophenol oxidoreductase subunit alpha
MATTDTMTIPTPRDAEFWLSIYRRMATIRHFEERVDELYKAAIMPGLAHLSIGQEGTEVGICAALRDDDYITSTHRGHGHCLAKGAQPDLMYAELLGKEAGYCRGKGGSMHIADQERNNLGANAIVGGSAGIATGAAMSAKMRGTDQVAVCFFGEGALGQGLLYETMNMASIWKLPVIYVCENNEYSEYTPYAETTSGEVVGRPAAFGIPAEQVDGQDVRAVFEAAQRLVESTRAGNGPAFLEAKTYRYRGHHVGDVDRRYYRSREEEEEWARDRDPLRKLADWLIAEELAEETTFNSIHEEVGGEIEAAVQFAMDAPFPDPSEVDQHVYA